MVIIFFPNNWGMPRVRQYRQVRYLDGEYFRENNGQFRLEIKMPLIRKRSNKSMSPLVVAALFASIVSIK